jgi:hypothetical protein
MLNIYRFVADAIYLVYFCFYEHYSYHHCLYNKSLFIQEPTFDSIEDSIVAICFLYSIIMNKSAGDSHALLRKSFQDCSS